MIILPTRLRLERRRDALYKQLRSVLHCASVQQVESLMRNIHGINLILRTYFIRQNYHEPEELFEDKDPFETEDPTLSQIEEVLREIQI